MEIPWDAVVIIAIGAPLGIWWYLTQVKLIWNSVITFKTVKKSMMMGQSPEEVKKILGQLMGASKNKKDKEEEKEKIDRYMYQ